jgi:hypothetical protein
MGEEIKFRKHLLHQTAEVVDSTASIVADLVKKSPSCTEYVSSFPLSQLSTTGPYPAQRDSIPDPHTHLNILPLLPFLCRISQ